MTKGTQSDKGLEFDGIGAGPSKGSSKYAGNKTGLTARANYGRGPVKGNDGACHDPVSGSSNRGTYPYTRAVPSTKISNVDKIGGHAQFRGDSTVAVKKPGAEAKINVGRGPTKGNCGC